VKLDASRSIDVDGTIEQYQWVASDGKTAYGVNAHLTFTENGSYTAIPVNEKFYIVNQLVKKYNN
jgi:hypothetical protein